MTFYQNCSLQILRYIVIPFPEFLAHSMSSLSFPEEPIPERFTVANIGPELTITWRWFSSEILLLAMFCVAWDSILIFFGILVLRNGQFWLIVLGLLFFSAHIAAGISLTYSVLAGLLNQTRIRITSEELTVRHGPLPFGGNRRMPFKELDQLLCEEEIVPSRRGDLHYFKVSAITLDGKKVLLLRDLQDKGESLFIKQQIEKYFCFHPEADRFPMPPNPQSN